MEPVYTTEKAIELIREVEPKFAAEGIHTALTGSTLYKGKSVKDFDLFLYSHSPSTPHTLQYVRELLNKIGFKTIIQFEGRDFKNLGSGSHNGRVVDIMEYKGYRVDVFLDLFPIIKNEEVKVEVDEDVPF